MASIDRANGYPGKAEIIYDDSGKFSMDSRLNRNLHRYQLYYNLLLGGDRVLHPPPDTRHPITGGALPYGTYLNRLPAESPYVSMAGRKIDPFELRVNQSAHEAVAEQIVSTYVDLFFRQEVDRSPVLERLPEAVRNDIDLRGNNVEDFLRQVYYLGLGLGAVAVLTDLPRVDEDFPSRYHEVSSGRRPFCRVILPQQIYQWDRDQTTGVFRWVLIRESEDRYVYWDSTVRRVMDKQGTAVEADVEHGFRRVPVDLFVAKEPDLCDESAPMGVSAIASTALLQLQLDDHASLLDDLQRKTNYPLLNCIGDAPTASEVQDDEVLGAGWELWTEQAAQWISPDPDSARVAREHIDALESRIYKLQGVHRRSQDSVEAHSGLALDYESAPIYATVRSWASRLRNFENKLWRTLGELSNIEIPPGSVQYPEDFTTRPVDLEVKQSHGTVEVYGGYSSAPEPVKRYVDLKISRAVERDTGHLDEGKQIASDLRSLDYSEESATLSSREGMNGLELERGDDRDPQQSD